MDADAASRAIISATAAGGTVVGLWKLLTVYQNSVQASLTDRVKAQAAELHTCEERVAALQAQIDTFRAQTAEHIDLLRTQNNDLRARVALLETERTHREGDAR